MSMRTYLLLVFERETGLDYWTEAIAGRGWQTLRDDVLGGCKFAGLDDGSMTAAVRAITGLDVTDDDLRGVVRRAFLRGMLLERRQGFTDDDYALPGESHIPHPQIQLPQFVTHEFMDELRSRVGGRIDSMLSAEGLVPA